MLNDFCPPGAGLKSRLLARIRWAICPFPQIETALPREGLILDIGCGFGFFSRYLARRSPNRRVLGVDSDPGRIRLASYWHRDVPNLDFQAVDGALWYPPQAGGIVMVDLLHHMDPMSRQALMSRCAASIRPGGTLAIKEIGRRPAWKYGWNYLHDLAMTRGARLYFFSQGELPQLAARAGFNLGRRELSGAYPYPHELWVGTLAGD